MIKNCMKRHVYWVSPEHTVLEAARLVAQQSIGTLPVLDERNVVIGVVRLQDLLKVFMPDFVTLLDNIDFVHDFGALEAFRPRDLPAAVHLTMRDLMQPAISVRSDAGLLRAFAIMVKHQLQDLPVVDQAGRLVGIASRVDIAAAFLRSTTDGSP